MVPKVLWPALAGAKFRRPCQPRSLTSNHLSYPAGLLKPQENVEASFG